MATRARFAWLAAAVLVAGCGAPRASTGPSLTVFAAASLTDVIQAVGDVYAREHPVDLTYNFAASGALAQQLLAAPRADLFVSASERWMDAVQEGGRIVPGSRRTLLSNTLVVIANTRAGDTISSPAELCAPRFRYLAIGDPESVPAGRYARDWLRSVACADGTDAWSHVAGRVSPAPDVRAAMAQVEGSADVAGIVYRTDYAARHTRVRLAYEVPADAGPTIRYPAAIVAGSDAADAAADFLGFLGGPTAAALFREAGFTVVDTDRGSARAPVR